jgi:molybdopterin-synthase adenylyltransferase
VMAEIIVRAGIGRLTLVDRDYIDESNLQRQSLFTESDCREGLPKATAAAAHLSAINSRVVLDPRIMDVNAATIAGLVEEQDLILDGTDNFEARFLINDASVKWGIPWVYGACVGAYGLCVAFVPGKTPCLRCVLGQLPPPGSSPTCDTVGVIGPIVHLVAAWEVAEGFKILTGRPERLNGKLMNFDLWENQVSGIDLANLRHEGECPACGQRNFEFLEGRHESRAQLLCGRDAIQLFRTSPGAADFTSIANRLASVGTVTQNEFLLKAQVDQLEIVLFRDGRAIIRGTHDPDEARRIYAKYIGN